MPGLEWARPESLKSLAHWVKEFSDNSGVPNHTLIILANKSDLKDKIAVTSQDIDDCIKNDLIGRDDRPTTQIRFFETSAKSGQNVDEAFEHLGHSIVKKLYS